MFNTPVSSTALNTQHADRVFQNLSVANYRGDVTLSAILRAIVAPKIPRDLEFCGVVHCSYVQLPTSGSDADRMKNLCGGYDMTDPGIRFFMYGRSAEETASILDYIQANIGKVWPGYTEVEKIRHYFKDTMRIHSFVNAEKQAAAVFLDHTSLEAFHLAMAAIPASLPFVFQQDGKNLMTDLDKRVLASMWNDTPDGFLDAIAEAAAQYDFRGEAIRAMLGDFEIRYMRQRADAMIHEIERIHERIRDYNRKIAEQISRMRESDIQLTGLQTKIASGQTDGNNEIMEYFLRCPNLVLEYVGDNDLRFSAKTLLQNYDEDQAESVISNRSSVFYDSSKNRQSKDNTEALLRAIFLDRVFKIRSVASYTLNLNGNVEARGGEDYTDAEFTGYLPNPHVNGYSCMGGNEAVINEYMMQRNYIGAIEQCVYSAGNLNFNDYTVLSSFTRTLFRDAFEKKFLLCEDGELISPKEAISRLEAARGKKE